MVKVAKKIICIIMMAIIMIMPNVSKAASALETFVNSSEFGKVTEMPTELNDFDCNYILVELNSTLNAAAQYLSLGGDAKENAKRAKEWLESEYDRYINAWYSERTKKTCSYIGYRLGCDWKTYKALMEEDSSEKTPAEKFDEKYAEFKKLPEDQQKNTQTAADYYKQLLSLYNQLTKEQQNENNRSGKLNEVYMLSIAESEKTMAEKFDEKYAEFKKLPEEKQKDIATASSYEQQLRHYYNELSEKEKKENNRTEKMNEVAKLAGKYVEEGPGGSTGLVGGTKPSSSHTVDEIITGAKSFLLQATETTINGENLKAGSSTLYNILLSLGIALAVIVGIYLGVKFMVSTVEDKAKVKEALIPYVAGCVIVFSSFIIWKLIVTILGGIG